ncbi:DUF6265 family protein [Pedobacter sp.]
MMKNFLLSTAFLITLSFCSFAQNQNINNFNFLLGKWEMKTKNGKVVERWTKHRDSLTATSHKFDAKGDSILTEAVVLKKIDGVWHYCVTGFEKGNEGKTNFKLVAWTSNIFTFENKQHDFPQKISYQNKGKEELLAWIEGNINGKTRKISFPYVKQK